MKNWQPGLSRLRRQTRLLPVVLAVLVLGMTIAVPPTPARSQHSPADRTTPQPPQPPAGGDRDFGGGGGFGGLGGGRR